MAGARWCLRWTSKVPSAWSQSAPQTARSSAACGSRSTTSTSGSPSAYAPPRHFSTSWRTDALQFILPSNYDVVVLVHYLADFFGVGPPSTDSDRSVATIRMKTILAVLDTLNIQVSDGPGKVVPCDPGHYARHSLWLRHQFYVAAAGQAGRSALHPTQLVTPHHMHETWPAVADWLLSLRCQGCPTGTHLSPPSHWPQHHGTVIGRNHPSLREHPGRHRMVAVLPRRVERTSDNSRLELDKVSRLWALHRRSRSPRLQSLLPGPLDGRTMVATSSRTFSHVEGAVPHCPRLPGVGPNGLRRSCWSAATTLQSSRLWPPVPAVTPTSWPSCRTFSFPQQSTNFSSSSNTYLGWIMYIADSLSRLQVDQFRRLAPAADAAPTPDNQPADWWQA